MFLMHFKFLVCNLQIPLPLWIILICGEKGQRSVTDSCIYTLETEHEGRYALPSLAVSQIRARASGRLFHSWTWKAFAALGSVSVKTNIVACQQSFIRYKSKPITVTEKHTELLTEDIIGSMIAATSICFTRSRGMPISMAAAARRRTLEAECTTSGMTSFAHRTAPSPIWVGTCSSIL